MTEASGQVGTERDPEQPRAGRRRASGTQSLMRRLGLHRVTTDRLTIRRRRCGRGFLYLASDGTPVRDPQTLRRLASLAVPPAYEDVFFAEDPSAHIQAVGRDAAGRLQYRYHPDWEKVRELRKARRLERLAAVLPRVRRSVAQHLASAEPTREFAFAAVVELVAATAIRAGSESYARLHGTRGAATLLKSNVSVSGDTVALSFRAKGGKTVRKDVRAPRLGAAIAKLSHLSGRRLFQYRDDDGTIHHVRARDVNGFLRSIAGVRISLKDLRTLCASAMVLDLLARIEPAGSARRRRSQVLEAVRIAADNLANTPAICRRSYVHETIVAAFEKGVLERFAAALKDCRSPARRQQLVGRVVSMQT